MSQAACRMDEIRRDLVAQDRERAIRALMKHIHYELAPKVPLHSENPITVDIFGCLSDIEEFCREQEISSRAFEWLLKDLRASNLLEQTDIPVTLSRNGVSRFCRD